jgi:serine/threonine protein kinase
MSLFENKYKIIEKLGSGTGGAVFKAKHVFKNELCAIKIEIKKRESILCREAQFYRYLENMGNTLTSYSEYMYPKLRYIGSNNNYNYIVMDLLDKSLETIKNERGGFTLKTTLLISIQMIQLLNTIHNNYIIHRDIKPSNFMFGYKDGEYKLYLIDFGLCVYGENGEIYNVEKPSNFIGNLNYASYMSLINKNPNYRDDIESVIYIMIEMYLGKLPWANVKLHEKNISVLAIKKHPKLVYDFCKFNKLPPYMLKVVEYVLFSNRRNLDYNYILMMLRNQLYEQKYKEDYQYDWL